MHETSFEKAQAFVELYLAEHGDTVLDIVDFGSRVVADGHGSYRPLFDRPGWTYRGVDIVAGPNVDVTVANPYNWSELASDGVDVLITGQTFEHIAYFWVTAFEIARVLRPGGLAVIIAPSTGDEHRYPVDCWRYYPDGLSALAAYVGFELLDVFTDWERGKWGDSVCVLRTPVRDAAATQAFARRAWLQKSVLVEGLPRPGESGPAASVSPLASVTGGRLTARLEQIRRRDVAGWRGLVHRAPQAARVLLGAGGWARLGRLRSAVRRPVTQRRGGGVGEGGSMHGTSFGGGA